MCAPRTFFIDNFHRGIVLNFGYKFHVKCQSRSNPKFLCLFLTQAIVVASLISLAEDIHENPKPLGGRLTDNFAKKSLLKTFLSVNDFDNRNSRGISPNV